MAFSHVLPGQYVSLLNNNDEESVIVYRNSNDGGDVVRTYVRPDGSTVVADGFPLAPRYQYYELYPSGDLKLFERHNADGSHIVLNFAEPIFGLSLAFGLDYGHGPLVSSTFTSASGYTITQEFSQGHLLNYSFDSDDLHIVASHNISANTYSIAVQNSVHTSPLVATGGGNIDPFVKVISNDGSSLISQDGAGLISQDGAGFKVNTIYKGASIISDHASGLNMLNIAALISQDGAGVISNDGSSLISQDGAGIVIGGRTVGNDGITIGSLGSSLLGDEALQFIANTMAVLGRGMSLYTGPTTFTSGPADDNTEFFIRLGEQRIDKIDFLGDTDLWDIRQEGSSSERQLIAGVTYLIDLKGTSTDSGTLIDPFLRIYAADKATVVAQSDDDGTGFNARLYFTPTTTGFYYIEAGARDDGSSGTYTLSLLDPSPVIMTPGDSDAVTISVAENNDNVTFVTATDPDSGSALQYSIIGGADADRFFINPGNGQLVFRTAPNFESPTDVNGDNSYIVQVQVSDGTFVDTQTITVNVTDVDEGPLVPEIAMWGNHIDIVDGAKTKSLADFTDFGTAKVGGILERTFFVLNQGSAPLRIDKIVTPAGFRVADDDQLAGLIQPGSFDSFKVYMDTSKVWSKTGQIVITSNDADEKTFNFTIGGSVVAANPEIELTGNGINIADGDKTPDAADGTSFGTVLVGGSVERTFTISNTGEDPLTITNVLLTPGLTLVDPPDATIAPGEFDTFTVRFTAAKAGTFKGTVKFDTNDTSEAKYDFAVGATVLAALTPEIAVSGNGTDIRNKDRTPDLLDHTNFEASGFGSAGMIRTFTIDNTGLGELLISNLTLPDGFSLVTAPPDSIAANSSAAFAVQIDTSVTGTRGGTITIFSNDKDEAQFTFNITGSVGPQQHTGDGGPNIFMAGAHAEAFAGEGGNDTVSYAAPNAPAVVASLAAPAKNTGFAAGDTYSSIENLVGSAFNDTLTGNAEHNVLEGGKGADKLDGGSTLATDIDLASYINAAGPVTADLLKSKNNTGEAAGDTYKNIEGLIGSLHNDTLVGNAANNRLFGVNGDDTLIGNGGEDMLTGGPGADTFVFNAIKDGGGATKVLGVDPPPTGDLITDFVSGEDFIGISRKGFKIAATLDEATFQTMDYFLSETGVAPTTANQTGVTATANGHGQFLFNQTTAQLWWDPDGAGTKQAAVLLATFTNGAHLTAADFDLM